MSDINNEINTDPKKASILIVDDEETNVLLLEKLLKAAGYSNVISTQDPVTSLILYQQHNSDLILLDLDMPKLDGYGVMKQLNALTRGNPPPIIVLTAQHMQSYRQRALDNGARDYVTKPFDIPELLSRVRNLLEVQMAHKFMSYQNEILEQKVQQRTQAIHDTRLEVVRRLGMAAEYRDNETGFHIVRMSKMAALLGKIAGMGSYETDLLLNAAPMHDIGKIGIPDNILLKQGGLEVEEWEIMKSHAQIGADILSGDDSDLLRMAQEIALTHHEKWDGSGYPNNLKGEEIPLVGRLCAIADVFDALASDRPYKKAWSVEKVVDLIKSENGKHFDPALVDLFMQNIHEFIEIKEQYSEPEQG